MVDVPVEKENPELVGRDARAAVRDAKIQRAVAIAHQLIAEHLQPIVADSPNQDVYDGALLALESALKTELATTRELGFAIEEVAKFIERGNLERRWNLPVPARMLRLQRHRKLGTLAWVHRTQDSVEFARQFEALLTSPGFLASLPAIELMSLLLVTAPCYGGLCQEPLLRAMIGNLPWGLNEANCGGQRLLWIDLRLDTHRVFNAREKNQPYFSGRWLPDSLSLAVVQQFQRNASSVIEKADIAELHTTLRNVLARHGLSLPGNSLAAWTRRAIAVAGSRSGVDLPQALMEVAMGRQVSVPIPSGFWALAMGYRQPQSFQGEPFALPRPAARLVSQRNIRRRGSELLTAQMYAQLTESLKTKDGYGRKISQGQVVQTLASLDTSAWTELGQWLCEWYRVLLVEQRLAVSSVRRYHVEIALGLLVHGEAVDFGSLDSDELYATYTDIIEESNSANQARYRAARLDAFHQFASNRGLLAPLTELLDDGSENQLVVRAGYLSHSVILAVRETIRHLSGANELERMLYECILVLAYRTGLRIQELLKLQLRDVEPSPEQWLFVRVNAYGDNKSGAARRKVPLACLLTEEETGVWRNYWNHRRKARPNASDLLFSLPDQARVALDSGSVSAFLSGLMRKCAGESSIVFHHLRHTAINNLYLIAESQWDLVLTLAGYGEEQCRQIYRRVFRTPAQKLRRYWALAAFAGHSSPGVTFQRYVHFADVVSQLRLSGCDQKYTETQCRALLAVSPHKFTKFSRQYFPDIQSSPTSLTALRIPLLELLQATQLGHQESPAENSCERDGIESTAISTVPGARVHVTPQLAHRLLSELKNYSGSLDSFSLAEYASQYGVSHPQAKSWVESALKLATMRTRKNASRFRTEHNFLGSMTIPARPPQIAIEADAGQIIQQARGAYRTYREAILWTIRYYLQRSNTSNSPLPFLTMGELRQFLSWLTPDILPASRWLLRAKNTKDWLNDLGIPVEASTSHNNSAYLHLVHPQVNPILAKDSNEFDKYSAATMRYVFVMLAIMIPDVLVSADNDVFETMAGAGDQQDKQADFSSNG